ncbi:MAG: putative metal-dependent hydrolase [Chloroflexi bacterium]|nr:putative metal-dependent hydrolase [Chloroflexota bacterium]
MLTPEQRQELINIIRNFPAQLEARVKDLDERQLKTRFIPGEWSVIQNVHHLADSHMNAYIRTKLLLLEDRPTIKPYNQNDWAETPDATETPLEVSLAILRGLHARWADLFDSLKEEDWACSGIHPESGEITIESLLQTYARHGAGHIEQINKTLAADTDH